jgi:ketosteroid isomerase-like protein
MPSESDNLVLARRYLEALERGDPEGNLAVFADDAVQEEFPNRLVPQGATRDLAALRESAQRGSQVMAAQRHEVQNAIASGDQVALEVRWTGTLAVPFGGIPAGGQLAEPPEVEAVLIPLLMDRQEDGDVRSAAFQTLCRTGDSPARAEQFRLLLDDDYLREQVRVYFSLRQQRGRA